MPKQTAQFGRNWYAIHTYSGYEDSVARNIRQRIESMGMEDKIFDVLVPTERVIKIKKGKRQVIEEKIYPGYILVDMIVTDDSWYVIRNTPRVTGFVGAGNTPVPISEKEITELKKRMGVKEPEYTMDFSVGELIKITDGPFKDFEGKISDIDRDKGRLKVLVNMFGRETPVDLDFLQVKKI